MSRHSARHHHHSHHAPRVNVERGTRGDDDLVGTNGRDLMMGGRGDDRLTGGSGNDVLNGGRGFDTAVFAGGIEDYSIWSWGWRWCASPQVIIVTALGGAPETGTDILRGIEALYFEADDFTLFMNGENNAVLAGDDALATSENGVLTVAAATLLANDREFDGEEMVLLDGVVTSSAGASVTIMNGEVTYVPGALFDALSEGETATDSFTYVVDDGQGGTDIATVTVTITGENDAPVVRLPNVVSLDENTTQVTSAQATDAEGDAITFALSGADAALFTINATTGEISFLEAPDFEAPLDADADNAYDISVTATDALGASNTADLVVSVEDVDEIPEFTARINEFHYDNTGSDVDEFIEVRVAAGDDVSALNLELINGNGGGVYGTFEVAAGGMTTDGTWDYYVISLPSNGLQNSDEGLVLANGTQVIEFLSYEGTVEANEGSAAGLTSTDIGVFEASVPLGFSLQRLEDGTWDAPRLNTQGTDNTPIPETYAIVINEIMQNPAAVADSAGEYFELFNAGASDVDLNGWTISDNDSDHHVIDNGGPLIIPAGGYLVLSNNADFASNGGVSVDYEYSGVNLSNSSDELVLTDALGGEVDRVEWDNGATFPDPTGAAMELIDPSLDNAMGTNWEAAMATFGAGDNGTPGAENGTGGGGVDPTETTLISLIQGTGGDSSYANQTVKVSAIVTHITGTGFYIQEEESDADLDALTSEGLFIYTGGGDAISLGDLVEVTGAVVEYYGMTQISSVSETRVVSSGHDLPAAVLIGLSPDAVMDYETVEGMRVSVGSGNRDALTVIENFNLDRYGEITISAGTQTQPTQLYDAQTEAAEIAEMMAANGNGRLLLDDGSSVQNPDVFEFLPGGAGDNGDGVLDAGDDFSDTGTTIRLGAELTANVEGVMNYAFGDWRVTVTETLEIDESTNVGARQDAPEDVGGTLQVASYNVLNFFSTLDDGSLTGPNGDLSPRGADNAAEFTRQADKIVEGLITSGAEVIALQEIENNGHTDGSAIDALVGLLNAQGTGANYDYVDPTGDKGFVGSDAIMTGILFDANAVTLSHADYIEFDEPSAEATFAAADAIASALGLSFNDYQRNRPSVAATFTEIATGQSFTIVSSHFKSKGDSGLQSIADAGQAHIDGGGTLISQAELDALLNDPNFDQGDGQGFWNAVRTDAAVELAQWVTSQYNGGGVDNYVLLGDMNAYAEEDPVQYLDDVAGFTDVIDTFIGQDEAYSYVFDGQQGTLDQGFIDPALLPKITGATEWHINADEPDLIGYDDSFTNPAFFNDGVFASSDHDPLIVGLDLGGILTIS
ncbi:MAG: ExeM/NucH family extracellular endonuclease [Maritimibacter sp.]